MRALIEQDIFYSLRDSFRVFARDIIRSNRTTLLLSEPTMKGSLSLAPIEAALLDADLPYRRRFTNSNPDSGPFIQIIENDQSTITTLPGISISTIIVEGLRGRFGDSRKGPLSTVAQAHALALEINPLSPRLRRMRPWILSGNWINEALDSTYDPVFSFLRDYLSAEGTIRIVPITEVPIIEKSNFPWLKSDEIDGASNEWEMSDIRNRETIMGALVKPILHSKSPSTSRVEELLWHCVLGSGWESDLSSQISRASSNWKNFTPIEAASIVTDSLVSTGAL